MIVVIDVGTSGLRVSIIDKYGCRIHCSQESYSLSYPMKEAVEMDMRFFTAALWNALKNTAQYVKDHNTAITAFSVTAQRSSVIPVDKDGEALCPALMWQDTRASCVCNSFKSQEERIYALSGMRLSPVSSAPKMRWLKENKTGIYNKAYKLISFCEYTLFQLTGVFAVDTSIASRSSLFDITRLCWNDELLDLFGIEKEKLCPIIPVGSSVGYASRRLCTMYGLSESVPVISAGGDQQCAALGLGCIEKGDIIINMGTGAFVLALTDKPMFSLKNGTSCNVSALKDKWITEGAVLSAGKTLDWVNRQFFKCTNETHPYENFTAACLSAPPGSNGMRFSIHFSGKGSPEWNPSVQGALYGLNFQNTKNDIARAVLEGIAAGITECIFCVEQTTGVHPHTVHISGGLAKDALFACILAAMCRKELIYTHQTEATSFGAWISAAIALGLYPSAKDAFGALSKNMQTTVYKSTAEESCLYEKIASELKILYHKEKQNVKD